MTVERIPEYVRYDGRSEDNRPLTSTFGAANWSWSRSYRNDGIALLLSVSTSDEGGLRLSVTVEGRRPEEIGQPGPSDEADVSIGLLLSVAEQLTEAGLTIMGSVRPCVSSWEPIPQWLRERRIKARRAEAEAFGMPQPADNELMIAATAPTTAAERIMMCHAAELECSSRETTFPHYDAQKARTIPTLSQFASGRSLDPEAHATGPQARLRKHLGDWGWLLQAHAQARALGLLLPKTDDFGLLADWLDSQVASHDEAQTVAGQTGAVESGRAS